MKKLFLFAVMFVAVALTGCSKEESSSDNAPEFNGMTPYSGVLLGDWMCEDGDDEGVVYTFYSNGTFKMLYAVDDEWKAMSGTFTVTDNVLCIEYLLLSWDYDGDAGSESMYNEESPDIEYYYYDLDVEDYDMALVYLGHGSYLTLESALNEDPNYNNADYFNKK